MKHVYIVIGLGFGDEGKGLCTDYLCAKHKPASTIVVRFNGGHQAGHNVVIGNRQHVHSNFGSGTLRGYSSYFSKYCTVYPITLYNEWIVLLEKKIAPDLIIDPMAIVTTPYDVIYNQFREEEKNHGSCGLGIGSTMHRHNTSGYKVFAADLTNKKVLTLKLANLRTYYLNQLKLEGYSTEAIIDYSNQCSELMTQYLDAVEILFLRQPPIIKVSKLDMAQYNAIIFEGAQGVMLDMDHGIFPNVTYSNTTSKNALELCSEWDLNDISIFYITRCYQTRHGYGPMTSDENVSLVNNADEINVYNKWQKEFKTKKIDYDLINFALKIDSCYHPEWSKCRIDTNLLITCNDQLPDFEFDTTQLKFRGRIYKSYAPDQKGIIKQKPIYENQNSGKS